MPAPDRKIALPELARSTEWPDIRFHYLQAALPSLTVQRNQGITKTRAATLFLLDDNSSMYRDYADQVMTRRQTVLDEPFHELLRYSRRARMSMSAIESRAGICC